MVAVVRQIRQPMGVFIDDKPHPSWGGNAYSLDIREEVITRWFLGIPLESPELQALRDQYVYPCYQTCVNWIEQYRQFGHWRPKIAT